MSDVTCSQEKRGRLVTDDEAEASAHRLIHSHFHTPDQARCSMPARPEDDDLTIVDYVRETRALRTSARKLAEALTIAQAHSPCDLYADALSDPPIQELLRNQVETKNENAGRNS